MAESGSHKGGIFAKSIQKRMVRTKEKVLQHLGQADRTTDDIFDEHVANFQKQQNVANRLQKELKNYITCVKAMSAASKTFYEAIQETYEEDWVDNEEVVKAVESLNLLWEDYMAKLSEQVQLPLQAYICRFPEVRAKIAKRGRKLVDYDSKRHTVESLKNAKKKDEAKISKAEEELAEAKKIYEDLNNELREELPTLYEQRRNFVSSHLNALFSTELKFEEESAKLKSTLVAVTDKLSEECGPNVFTCPPSTSIRYDSEDDALDKVGGEETTGLSSFYKVPVANDVSNHSSDRGSKGSAEPSPQVSRPENGLGTANGEVSSTENLAEGSTEEQVEDQEEAEQDDSYEPVSVGEQAKESQPYEPVSVGAQVEEKPTENEEPKEGAADAEGVYSVAADTDDIYKVPGSNEPVNPDTIKDGILYQMEAIHPYAGEDTDELTFEMGEMIEVIPFEDPEDQMAREMYYNISYVEGNYPPGQDPKHDDGWLMGKKSTGERGVFPANFCKRI